MSYLVDLNAAAQLATEASARADSASEIFHAVAHGLDSQTVTTENGEVLTLANAVKKVRADILGFNPKATLTGDEVFWAVQADGTDIKVPVSQIKLVDSVNGKQGVVTLDHTDVGAIPTTEKGSASGVATLGVDGKVPDTQVPELAVTNTHPAIDEAAMLSLSVSQGDFAERSDTGTVFLFRGGDSTLLSNWREFSSEGAAVNSVNSKTGDVVLGTDDIAEGATNKYYPSTDATKLSGIEAGAQVNAVDSVNGKTGIVSLTAADVSAVPTADKGVANGVATLDLNGLVPEAQLPATGIADAPSDGILYGRKDTTWVQVPSGGGGSGVALFGPTTVGQGKTATYTITNFNSFSTYSVSATSGTVTFSGDTINYDASSTGNSDTLSVVQDGTTYSFSITLDPAGIQGNYTQLSGGATARYAHTSVTVNGILYVFGGFNGSVRLNDLWKYDPSTDSWVQLASGATAREYHGSASANGILYVFGGFNGSVRLNDLWKYDPSTDVWTQLTSGATASQQPTLVEMGGLLYLFGGYTGSVRLNELWKYDPSTDVWTQLTSGATARNAHSAVAMGSNMYVFGGSDGTVVNDLWKYDSATDVWTQLTSGATARYAHTASADAADGLMYVFGGAHLNSYLGDLWKYDSATDVWTQLTSGATGRRYPSSIMISGSMYLFGGNDSTKYLNDLWRID